jgi:2-keto-3-deoxy-L-rhamnonate aldolase RhmA
MKNFKLKNQLKKGDLTVGSWITLGSNDVTEIMAQSGFE